MVRVFPLHFGVVLGCKGGGGKKKNIFRSRKVFSSAGIPNRAKGRVFHDARAWKFILAWYEVAKEAGGKNFLGPENSFFKECRRPKQGSTGQTSQDKPREAKGSLPGQMICWICCGPGWYLASTSIVAFAKRVRARFPTASCVLASYIYI